MVAAVVNQVEEELLDKNLSVQCEKLAKLVEVEDITTHDVTRQVLEDPLDDMDAEVSKWDSPHLMVSSGQGKKRTIHSRVSQVT